MLCGVWIIFCLIMLVVLVMLYYSGSWVWMQICLVLNWIQTDSLLQEKNVLFEIDEQCKLWSARNPMYCCSFSYYSCSLIECHTAASVGAPLYYSLYESASFWNRSNHPQVWLFWIRSLKIFLKSKMLLMFLWVFQVNFQVTLLVFFWFDYSAVTVHCVNYVWNTKS